MREAGVRGVRLHDLDELARSHLREAGATSPFLGSAPSSTPRPFDGVLSLSPNQVVVHRRPNGQRQRDGDLLSVDCGVIIDG